MMIDVISEKFTAMEAVKAGLLTAIAKGETQRLYSQRKKVRSCIHKRLSKV